MFYLSFANALTMFHLLFANTLEQFDHIQNFAIWFSVKLLKKNLDGVLLAEIGDTTVVSAEQDQTAH